MTEPKQLGVWVEPELFDTANAIAAAYGTTRRDAMELAIKAAAELTTRHATRAEHLGDPDLVALYWRAAKAMPVWLAERTVQPARFSHGRAALMVDDGDERWVLGEDDDGALMAVSQEGRLLGRVVGGRVEVLRDRLEDLAVVAATN